MYNTTDGISFSMEDEMATGWRCPYKKLVPLNIVRGIMHFIVR